MRPKNSRKAKREARLQQAITAFQNENISIRKVARDFDVPRQTLDDRLKGKLPRDKAQETQMHLTNEEEKANISISDREQRGKIPVRL